MRPTIPLRVFGTVALALGAACADELDTETTFTPLGQSSYRLDWIGEDGVTVFPKYSTNLVDWFYLPEVDQGVAHDPIDVTPLDGLGAPYPKFFMRLALSDYPSLDPKGADYDGDGISNWNELTVFDTDPLKADTDGDGLPDGQEDTDGDGISDQWERMLIEQSADPGSLTLLDIDPGDDFDDDGLSNWLEYQLGLSGYQTDSDGDGYSDRLSVDQELWLRLNESSGTIAGDDSGEDHDGLLASSPAWQATGGVDHGALGFDGGADTVELPAEVLDGASNLTLSLWFKTANAPAGQTLLSAAGAAQSPELAIGIENGDTIRFTTGGGNSVTWSAGRNLADNLWHHVVLVRDFVSGAVSLHLDGAPFGLPQTVSLGTLSVDALILGQEHQTVSTYDSAKAFDGLIDEVRIWSATLDSAHATELFQPNDLDLDGLPDDWELSLFGNLATLTAATDDLDGDGLSNRQEFEDGTDPNDYYNGSTPVISLVSGSGQTIYNGQRTADPLVFLVTDGIDPLVNAPVELSHLELIGGVETLDGDTLATSLTLRTDAEGKVAVYFKAD